MTTELEERLRVTLNDGSAAVLEAGVLDDDAIDAFLNGQCHALAVLLAEHLGAPLAVVADGRALEALDEEAGGGGQLSDRAFRDSWLHVVVELEDGLFLDASGLHDGAHLIQLCLAERPSDGVIARTTREQVLAILSAEGTNAVTADWAAAAAFIDSVIDEYLVTGAEGPGLTTDDERPVHGSNARTVCTY